MKKTYILNEKGELVEKYSDEYWRMKGHTHMVQGDIEPFVSPLDGSIINSRSDLRDHMRRHGVVPTQEFSQEYIEKKAEERRNRPFSTKEREERRRLLAQAYDKVKHPKSFLDFVLTQNARMNERRD